MRFETFWKNTCLWLLLIALGVSGQNVSGVTPENPPSSRDGLMMTSSEAMIIPNMTDHLTITCEFTKPANSPVMFVASIILSHWEKAKQRFRKLFSVSSFSPTLTVNYDVGAITSGALDQNGRSFLTLEWNYPNKEVATRYICSIHTMDFIGSPTNWNVGLEIKQESTNLSSLAVEVLALKKGMSKMKMGQYSKETSELRKKLLQQDETIKHLELQTIGLKQRVTDLEDAMILRVVFFDVHIDGEALYWINKSLTFEDAKAACIITGGKLAEFQFEQLKAVESKIKASGAGISQYTNQLWVGYHRDDISTNWKYASTGNNAGTLPLWDTPGDGEKCVALYIGKSGYDPDMCSQVQEPLCVRT